MKNNWFIYDFFFRFLAEISQINFEKKDKDQVVLNVGETEAAHSKGNAGFWKMN